MDLSLERIEAAQEEIDPVFLDTPQFVDERLSAAFGREVLVKVETLNPIGSFKGRGTWLLAKIWIPRARGSARPPATSARGSPTLRERGARVDVFVSADVSPAKVERMRAIGARVEVSERPRLGGARARRGQRGILVKDGLHPAIAEGAGTIGVELDERRRSTR